MRSQTREISRIITTRLMFHSTHKNKPIKKRIKKYPRFLTDPIKTISVMQVSPYSYQNKSKIQTNKKLRKKALKRKLS
jgi:hypothetical protein